MIIKTTTSAAQAEKAEQLLASAEYAAEKAEYALLPAAEGPIEEFLCEGGDLATTNPAKKALLGAILAMISRQQYDAAYWTCDDLLAESSDRIYSGKYNGLPAAKYLEIKYRNTMRSLAFVLDGLRNPY